MPFVRATGSSQVLHMDPSVVTVKRSTAERPGRDAVLKGCRDLQAPAFWEEEIGGN